MARKDFKGNPAMQFISQESVEKVDAPKMEKPSSTGAKKAPAGYKLNPEFIEIKSKRVQILLQPSLYEKAKEVSKELGLSMNDFIHRALQEAVYDNYVRELIE